MRRAGGIACLALLVSSGLWAGCAAGPAPVDRYYQIEVALPSAAVAKTLAGTLHVDRLRGDSLAGGRHVLYRVDGNSPEIHKHSYDRWTDSPAIAIQSELVSYLQQANAAEIVMTANARVRPDWTVGGRLNHFEHWTGATTQVSVELDLDVANREGEIILRETYTETRPVSGGNVAQAVAEMNQALYRIFERFLADLRAAS